MKRRTTTTWPAAAPPVSASTAVEALQIGQRVRLTVDKVTHEGTVLDTDPRRGGWRVLVAYEAGGLRCGVWRLASEVEVI